MLNGFRGDGTSEPRSFVAGADGWAHAPMLSGRVQRATVATSLVRPRITDPLTTTAVFVVVELEVRAVQRAQGLQTLALVTADGYRYSQLNDSGLDSLTLTQPGWTRFGNAVFELPADRVSGATLEVAAQSDMLVIYRAQLAFPDVVTDLSVQSSYTLAPARTEVTR